MVDHNPDDIRSTLMQRLGEFPPLYTPAVEHLHTEEYDTFPLAHLRFSNSIEMPVYGFLLIPHKLETPAPAVLYHHVHGGKYGVGKAMMLEPQSNGYADGIALAEAGFVVFGVDAYAFGERQYQGAAWARESGAATELSLFKQFLWEGKTLWGMMLHDDLLALAYLRNRPEVDAERIGTTGMSMGGSRATWVAALDGNLKAVIPIAQLTRYADFAATGDYALHSIYYYLPGALQAGIDMEHIVSLAAPAYQHILIGDSDPLSPYEGVKTIVDHTHEVYESMGAAEKFEVTVYENTGHVYTPAMQQAMIKSFQQHL